MRKQPLIHIGTWISDLLLLVGAVYYAVQFPESLIQRLVLPSVAVGIVVAVAVARSRFRMYGAVNPSQLLSMAVLWALTTCITLGAIHDLPQLTDWRTVYAVHLEPFYRLLHLGVIGYLVFWSLIQRPGWSKAEMGIVTILVYSAANGYLFNLHGEQFALILGLSLATTSLVLREHREAGLKLQLPRTAAPALLFLGWGLVATFISPYISASLTIWIRLANWVLVFFLITWTARQQSQQERLVGVILGITVVIAVAGLVGVAGYAERMGWVNAVRTRLFVRELHANGVGALMAVAMTLLVGIWSKWRSRRGRFLLGTALLIMLLCGLFTYSRGAALGLFAGLIILLFLTWKTRPIISRSDHLVMIVLATLPLLFIAISSTVRITEGEHSSRIEIWKVVFNVIQKRPVTGVGLGNHLIPYYCQNAGAERTWIYRDILSMVRQVGWHSHNLLLEIGEALGFVGLLLFVVLLVRGWAFVRVAIGALGQSSPLLLHATAAAIVSILGSHMVGLSLSAFTLLPACFWVLWGLLIASGEANSSRESSQDSADGMTASNRWASSNRTAVWLAMLCLLVTPLFVVRPLVVERLLRSTKDESKQIDKADTRSVIEVAAHLDPLRAEIPAILGSISTSAHARTLYQRASRLRPLYAPYHTKLGWLNWATDRFDDAVISFQSATALDRYGLDSGEHWTDLALAYAAVGRKADAVEAFCEAALLDPRSLTPPLWQRSGDVILLDAVYTRYRAKRVVDPALRNRLVQHAGLPLGGSQSIPFAPGSGFRLQDVLDRLIQRAAHAEEPEQTRGILFSVARIFLQWRLYARLDSVLEELTTLAADHAPSHAKLLILRGTSLRARGKLREAENAFANALSHMDHPRLHHQLGITRIQSDKTAAGLPELEEAAKSWDPSLLHDRSWMRYWRDLADAYKDAGRLDEAIAAYDVAQFLSYPVPAYVTSLLSVARAFRNRGDFDREVDVYRNTLRILSRWGKSGGTISAVLRRLADEVAASHGEQHFTKVESRALTRSLVERFPDLQEQLLRQVALSRKRSVKKTEE